MKSFKQHITESDKQYSTVWHISNAKFKTFDSYFTAQGIIWFAKNREELAREYQGASINSRKPIWLYTCSISPTKTAGWDEYERYGIGELQGMGIDVVDLDDTIAVLDSNIITINKIEQLEPPKNTIKENTENDTIVYRTCVLTRHPKTSKFQVTSLHEPKVTTPIEIGSPLRGRFYVGTKAKFCLAYYTGMSDYEEGETEVLLTLKVPSDTVVPPEEDAFMGSETVATNPIVIKIEKVSDIENKPEYQ